MEDKRKLGELLKDFVWVEVGEFMMGAEDSNENAGKDEKPQHKVRLSGFYISKDTVTVGQFTEFVEATGYQMRTQFRVSPWLPNNQTGEQEYSANCRNSEDAIVFCNYWNQKYGFAPIYDAKGNLVDKMDIKPRTLSKL